MHFKNVCLDSWATVLPDTKVLSSEIESKLFLLSKKMNLPSKFFELLTGIKERRLWDVSTLPSQMSTQSCKKLLEEAKLRPTDIDCLIHVSVSRDYLEPATALTVHHNLSLSSDALCFDLSNACLGFINGILMLANMIELGQIKRGIVVGTESPKGLVDAVIYKVLNHPNLTQKNLELMFPTLTLGAGSCAMLVSHKSVSKNKHALLGGTFQTASQFHQICKATPDTGIASIDTTISMETQAQTLMKEAIALAKKTWPKFLDEMKWKKENIHHMFSHQVGRMPRDEMIKTLELARDKDFPTYEWLGNMGSVSLPISFALGVEHRKPKSQDKIVLLGFGSGINCFFLGVQW